MITAESQHLIAVTLILTGTGLSAGAGKLTLSGALTGAVLAAIIYISTGFQGLGMLAVFFVTASLATAWKKDEKSAEIPSGNHQTKRSATQVLANAVVPATLGLLIFVYPEYTGRFQLMIAGSFASALADTLSSEMGMVYGRRFYNIVTWKREPKGLDGLVSMEGTLAGLLGAIVVAATYWFGYKDFAGFWIVIVAGGAGNLADSVLGASLERKKYLSNDVVNLFNTLLGALICNIFPGTV